MKYSSLEWEGEFIRENTMGFLGSSIGLLEV